MSRARPRVFPLLAVIATLTLGGSVTTLATDPPDGVAATLLQSGDMPPGLQPLGIDDATEFNIDFPSYDSNGGLDKVNQKWNRAGLTGAERVAAVIDFRMLFADDAAAQAYLDEAEEILSESVMGITLQPETELQADVVRRYAGTITGSGITAEVQNFLFRQGPVVSKVYILGFGTTIGDALPIAQAAAGRVSAWLATSLDTSPGTSPETTPEASAGASPGASRQPAGSPLPPGAVSRQWAIEATASSEYGTESYAAKQAIGAPDVAEYSDNPLAWAPGPPDGTTEWIELTYPNAVVPSAVTIVETYGNGAVVLVEALDPSTEKWVRLWAGSDTSAPDDVVEFRPTLTPVTFATDQVRITMGPDVIPGWSEIDAVELVGTTP